MEKNNVKVSPGEAPEFTLPQVKEYLKKDLSMAITMLDAIYRDPATFDTLAEYLHGRFMNAKHQEELKRQTELDLN